jgi:hypothetical protein
MKGLNNDIKEAWKVLGLDREDLTFKESQDKIWIERSVRAEHYQKEMNDAFMKFFEKCEKNEKMRNENGKEVKL